MSEPTTVSARMAQRYDTAANWTAANPTLLAGEIGVESDTDKIKIGTGSTAWNSLAYQPWATTPIPVNAGGTGQTTYTNGQLLIGNTTGNTLTKATLTAGSGVAITNSTGSITVAASNIVNADISATAEIAVSKLANGTARQLLQTDAAGTGVEFASNIDVPGTLDVTSAATFDNNVIIQGDLTVNGTETIINTQTLDVEDKNIVIGKVVTPSDITADGGGITLKGTTDKTINWIDATDAWTFSEHVNIVSTKEYRIAGTKVLDATSLGSGVTGSSLTSVGTIGTGTWQGTAINKTYLDATLVSTGDTGTVTSTMILDGTIVNADINASAAIVDTKLATIATAGKVSNSATTATNANTASAIVLRDASGNFTAGTITAAVTGAASSNVLKAGDTMTGALVVPLASEATPSLTFTGDLDTGVFSPGANQLALATNGTARLYIASDGKVGVGASEPAVALDISRNTGAGLKITDTAVTNASWEIRPQIANATKLFRIVDSTASLDRLVIDSSGCVGIGSTPDASFRLTINGNSAGVAPGILFTDSAASPRNFAFYINGNKNLVMRDQTAASDRLTIDSSGRLLVGTPTARANFFNSTVSAALQVEGTGNDSSSLSIVRNSADVGRAILTLAKTRGGSVGSTTVVQSGDALGSIEFQGSDGTKFVQAAAIQCEVNGTPGANDMPGRLVFSTTSDSASSPTERMRIDSSGSVLINTASNPFSFTGTIIAPTIYSTHTTASAANLHIATQGIFYRSTSSIKYKTDVETMQDSYADAILNSRPVWYKSTCKADNPDWGYWGFIAEEIAEIDPRLVHWKTTEQVVQENGSSESMPCDPEPEGVQYDRFVPHLVNLIKRQQQAIETLEAKVAALEAA
jgi:hypothetical protein